MDSVVWQAVLLVLGLTGLLILVGCSVNPVNSDMEELPEQDGEMAAGFEFQPAQSAGGLDLTIANLTYSSPRFQKKINGSGGTLVIPLPEDTCYLVVPAGALKRQKTLKVWVKQGLNAAGEKLTIYTFKPVGLNFQTTVALEHKSQGAEGTPVELWWDDPNDTGATFSRCESGKLQNQLCSFSVVELSTFAVWEAILPPAQNEESLPPNKLTQNRFIHYK
jgi:hypothetical protein